MKNVRLSGLVALLFALPLAGNAQQAIFTDVFANGSTTNGTSIPGGTPTQSSTSYDIASGKTATNSTPAGHLKIGLSGGTTSGFWEVQAVFAGSPVSLVTVGDYINLTYVFTDSIGTLLAGGTSSYIANGLYNSGGFAPVAGKLSNAGLTTASGSAYASGNSANWQGYASRVSNGGTSEAFTRAIQNGGGTSSANQDVVGTGFGSGSFNSPGAVTFDVNETASVSLTSGSTYTISYTIALTAPGTVTVTNILYNGAGTSGSVLFSQTNTATGTNVLTTSFDSLAIGVRNNGTSFDPIMDIGSISVTESIYGSPGPLFNMTGGGAGCQGSGFLVGLNGSVITNVYLLYTNVPATTNIAFTGEMQAGTGSAISFGPQFAAGTYSVVASNTVTSFTGLMIGNAVVSFFSAPTVTTQPLPLFVANNSAGVFSVKVSGGGLAFQWYRNGVQLTDTGEFSGSATSNLLINPATGADVANASQGYYCVIMDTCGLKTVSNTNSLTLDTPANLVWQGGNPNTNWDLNTTPNFTNSSGTAVVFHAGDNVTFDDSSTNPVVTIVGNYVAPGVITENASQSYAFTAGSASLIGNGSLVMNGAGTLTVSNANAFTGGATLNNGTLVIGTYNNPLGTGPIHMAGGTMVVPFSGSSSVGLNNDVDTVANSILQFNQTGTFALVLNGPLSGSPGQTLTLLSYDAATANNRVRLYSAFTNNASIILSSLGSEVEMAPYLSSGDQIYNGVISGSGGHVIPRGGGNAIFNAQNTYNDSATTTPTGYSLFMSSGNVGFGADSVSSTPPTIDSSPAGTGNIGINVGTEGGNCSFFAAGGAHTVGNHIIYTSATNTVTVFIYGANSLTLSGEFTLSGADGTGNTNRILNVTNSALTTISGVVDDANLVCGLNKTGGGTLALSAADTYLGPTTVGGGTLWINGQLQYSSVTVTNGSLGGSGSILEPVAVFSPGAIAPGTSAIGTLTIGNNLTIAGNGLFKLNKSLVQSNDFVSVSGTLISSGNETITVTNLGPALAVGDSFTLFSQPLVNGGTLTVAGGGMNWTNRLAIDGSIQALSVASTTANYPTNMSFSVSGGSVTIGWPATHLGWILQSQTNSMAVGLTAPTNTWTDITGTGSGTNATFIINRSNPSVFYRLRHP